MRGLSEWPSAAVQTQTCQYSWTDWHQILSLPQITLNNCTRVLFLTRHKQHKQLPRHAFRALINTLQKKKLCVQWSKDKFCTSWNLEGQKFFQELLRRKARDVAISDSDLSRAHLGQFGNTARDWICTGLIDLCMYVSIYECIYVCTYLSIHPFLPVRDINLYISRLCSKLFLNFQTRLCQAKTLLDKHCFLIKIVQL